MNEENHFPDELFLEEEIENSEKIVINSTTFIRYFPHEGEENVQRFDFKTGYKQDR